MQSFGSLLSCIMFVAGAASLSAGLATQSVRADEPAEPIRALLVIGGCCHDYAAQKDILTQGISARANVSWTIAYDPDKGTSHLNPVYENVDWAKGYDVIVHDECCADVKDLKTIDRILQPHRDGVSAVLIHCAMHSYRSEGWPDQVTPWFDFTGLKSTGHGPQVPIDLTIVDSEHSITEGMENWTTIKEELYNNYAGELLDHGHALMRGKQTYKKQDGTEVVEDCVVTWTCLYQKKTRVFATTLGHNNETVADPRYLDLVARGLLWSVDKLDEEHLVPAKRVLIDEISPSGK